MKSEYKIGENVYIISEPKIDGRYNKGKIIGVEFVKDKRYLGFFIERDFYEHFNTPKYTVAYVDCFTGKGCTDTYYDENLSKNKPQ